MNKPLILVAIVGLVALVLAGCTSATTQTQVPTLAPNAMSTGQSALPFATKSNSGGNVDVAVTPTALNIGEPMAFEIAMNTHSVDLSDDMTQIAILRDDAGKEYEPTAWDGGEPGGHHREGILKFTVLAGKPKSVELVIKGMAGVSERIFKWDLP